MCVHVESRPCSRTSLAPTGLWNLALRAVRDLAAPTSSPASAMFDPRHVHALSSRPTVLLADLVHTLGLYPLFLPPGMSSPNPTPAFQDSKPPHHLAFTS